MNFQGSVPNAGGLTRYHFTGLIVPLLAALSQMIWMRVDWGTIPKPLAALIAGAIVSVVAFLIFRYVPGLRETTAPMGKAVVLGLLTAEVCVFHAMSNLPPASSLFLFCFLYTFSAEKADGLD